MNESVKILRVDPCSKLEPCDWIRPEREPESVRRSQLVRPEPQIRRAGQVVELL